MKRIVLNTITVMAFGFAANAQNVNIPDANFKSYLVGNSSINTNLDTEIQVSEATAFTGQINCSGDNILDLTGIEAFTALTDLRCNSNDLTMLDLSQNISLIELWCGSNNLSALDISQNTALSILGCGNQSINSLDVSLNSSLTYLECYGNNISSINLTSNVNLEYLDIYNNNLNTLDLSDNPAISELYCQSNDLIVLNMKNLSTTTLTSFNASSNPNLTCIDVDDISAATSAWTNIDAGVNYSLNCQVDLVTSIGVQGQAGASVITTQGGTLQMEANVFPTYADDDTYTWSVTNGTGSASIDAAGLLTATTDGTVTVTATANDASGVTGSAEITISNQTVGINEGTQLSSLSIYPNPVTTQLSIDFNEEIYAIAIVDIMGKTVRTIHKPTNSIDVSDLTFGIYFVQIQTDKGISSKKFIKK